MGTHPIFESDFDCLTDIVVRMKLLATLLLVAPHGNALSSQIIWEDGGRIASTNPGAFGASQDLLYRNAEGRKDNLYGMAIDTRAGGESSGMFFNANGMTLWNPADNQALHFVDQDDPDQSNSKNPDFVDDGVSSRYYFTYEKLNLIVLKAVQEMTKELEKKEVSLAQIQEANELIENAINKL